MGRKQIQAFAHAKHVPWTPGLVPQFQTTGVGRTSQCQDPEKLKVTTATPSMLGTLDWARDQPRVTHSAELQDFSQFQGHVMGPTEAFEPLKPKNVQTPGNPEDHTQF